MNSIKTNKLDFIESLFPEEIVFRGEELLDLKDFVVSYSEQNVLCSISNSEYYVTLTQKVFDKIEYKCNCFQYDHDVECPHVILALLIYRAHLSDLKDKNNIPKKKSKSSQKSVDIGVILQNIQTDELHSFIKAYAKKDRKFSITFKTRFAHKVELPDNGLKYKQILDSILPPVSKREEKTRKSDLRQLSNVIIELCHQSQDLISMNQLIEATDILMVLSNKWEYTKSKQITDIITYDHVQQEIYTTWKDLSLKTIAPALLTKIYVFFQDLFSKSYFMPYHAKYNHGEIALLFVKNEKSRTDELSQIIQTKKTANNSEKETACYISLALRFEESLIEKYLPDLLNSPNLIPIVLERLMQLGAFTTGLSILKKLLQKEPDSLKLLEISQQISIGLKDWESAIGMTARLCKKTKRLYYYKKTRDVIVQSHIQLLIDKVLNELDSAIYKEAQLKMSIYHFEDKWSEILEYINETNDFKTLEKYAEFLDSNAQDEFSFTYVQLFDHYLENHIGEKANEFLHSTIDKLRRARCTYTADMILNFVKNKYPIRLESST